MPAVETVASAKPRIIDPAPVRLRHPRDLVTIALCTVGIVLVLVLATYAHGTTEGLADDVQGFSALLARILVIPVVLFEATLTLLAPVAVITELLLRRLGYQVLTAITAAVTALVIGTAAVWAIQSFGPDEMLTGLSVRQSGNEVLTLPVYVSAIVGLLVAAGPGSRRRTVRWTWNLLWFSLAVVLISGQVSIPGVLLVVLIGRLSAAAVKYAMGTTSERAYGEQLVEALQRIGFEPLVLARVRDVTADDVDPAQAWPPDDLPAAIPPATVTSWELSEEAAASLSLHGGAPSTSAIAAQMADPASVAITRYSSNRVYALMTANGPRLDVVVLDGDRQVVGFLGRMWRSIRLRGFEGSSTVSLRAVAERSALLAYAAESAGVRTPRLRGVVEVEDSMLLVQQHAAGTRSMRDVPDDDLTDAMLAELWRQIKLAHRNGLTHRGLTQDVVLIGQGTRAPQVWLTAWETGDLASSEFSMALDTAQMLAMLALRVGAKRALSSAKAADVDVSGVGPMLQSPVMPTSVRDELRGRKDVLPQLRRELVTVEPDASVEPSPIQRFSLKNLLVAGMTVVALVVIVTTVNLEQMQETVRSANPWWALAAFGLGATGWLGATFVFMAFAPTKLPFRKSLYVQVASSFVALAAPAGIGPATLNLRMLTQRGVKTSVAVATVALVQVSQFVVTVVVLILLSAVSGNGGVLRTIPSATVLIALCSVAVAAGLVMAIPQLRKWLLSKITPTLAVVWPRVSDLLSQPGRLTLGIFGNILVTLSNILAFWAALTAFGQSLELVDIAVIYLLANSAGSAVPTPGGLGAIETTLIFGLTTMARLPAPIATSAVVLFRIMTYWARIPFGWIAMKNLQKHNDI